MTDIATTDQQDMTLAAIAIFQGASNTFKSRAGKPVIIQQASMRHLPLILRFVEGVINGMNPEQLGGLIESIVQRQKAAIAAGKDPHNISLQELAGAELVTKAFGNVSLVAQLFAASLEHLPPVVAAFTNLSEAEFDAMDPDEGMLVAAGIFTVNYGFFTLRLPPILKAFMSSLASRLPSAKSVDKVVKKPIHRRK